MPLADFTVEVLLESWLKLNGKVRGEGPKRSFSALSNILAHKQLTLTACWFRNKKRKLTHNSSFAFCNPLSMCELVVLSVCATKRFVLHLHYGAPATITKANGIIYKNN